MKKNYQASLLIFAILSAVLLYSFFKEDVEESPVVHADSSQPLGQPPRIEKQPAPQTGLPTTLIEPSHPGLVIHEEEVALSIDDKASYVPADEIYSASEPAGSIWHVLPRETDLYSLILNSADISDETVLSVSDVFAKCHNKPRGHSYVATLRMSLENEHGDARSNTYVQLWKSRDRKKDLPYRTMMYVKEPASALGMAFLRWHYTAEKEKMADQWLYLPHIGKNRRISVRTLSDSILGSDLTYGDVEERLVSSDHYQLVKASLLPDNQYGYIVEVKPKESDDLYSKQYYSFVRDADDWQSCRTENVRFFDQHGELLKIQNIEWQTNGSAWLWKKLAIENVQSNHRTLIELTKMDISIRLADELFTERAMKKSAYWLNLE